VSGDRTAEANGSGQSNAVKDKAVAAVLDALLKPKARLWRRCLRVAERRT